MAKWVTFYYDILNSQIKDYEEHKNRQEAEEYYLNNYRRYFALNRELKKNFKLPFFYGYPTRKYCGMTKYKFDKMFQLEK